VTCEICTPEQLRARFPIQTIRMMTVFAIAALTTLALIALAGGAYLLHSRLRRREPADPLREDWWPQFEADFRDYAVRRSQREPETEQ
jgi:hypothetical protein